MPHDQPDRTVETRLAVVVEMLERAVDGVQAVITDVSGGPPMAPPPPPPPTPVEALTKALEGISERADALGADVRGEAIARRRANRIALGLLAALALLVALVGAVGLQNNRLAHDVKATNDHIADCTTAGGRCYEQGRQRTDAAVGVLTRISVYVSQCARLYPDESGPDFDRKLEACVAERIERARTAAPPPTGPPPGR